MEERFIKCDSPKRCLWHFKVCLHDREHVILIDALLDYKCKNIESCTEGEYRLYMLNEETAFDIEGKYELDIFIKENLK